MKKITALILTAAVISVSFAQVQRGNGTSKTVSPNKTAPAASASQNTVEQQAKKDKTSRKEMMHALSLTKVQKGKLKQMHQASKAKMDEINNDPSLSDEQKKMKLKELRKEQHTNTEALLTDEQKAKFKELQQKNHRQKKNKPSADQQ